MEYQWFTNGIMSTPDELKPWFINCGGTLQIVTIGIPPIKQRLGFINPGLTLYTRVAKSTS